MIISGSETDRQIEALTRRINSARKIRDERAPGPAKFADNCFIAMLEAERAELCKADSTTENATRK